MKKKTGAIFYIRNIVVIVLGWVVCLACILGKDTVENKTSIYIIGGVFGILPIVLGALSMIRGRKHKKNKEKSNTEAETLPEQSEQNETEEVQESETEANEDLSKAENGISDIDEWNDFDSEPEDETAEVIEDEPENGFLEGDDESEIEDDITYATSTEAEEEQTDNIKSFIEQLSDLVDNKMDKTEYLESTVDNVDDSENDNTEAEENESDNDDNCTDNTEDEISDETETIESEGDNEGEQNVESQGDEIETKSVLTDSETMMKFMEFTSRFGRIEELLKAVNNLEESYKHFHLYINGKTTLPKPKKKAEHYPKAKSKTVRVNKPNVETKASKPETAREKSNTSETVLDFSDDDEGGPLSIDVSEYRENLPMYEWIGEDKRDLKRPDDNNGEIWWNKELVDKYSKSNPEFEYTNPFGRIFLNTVWYIDGNTTDHAVMGFIHDIEAKGGRTHRELSSRCTHLLITESADETTFTKNMAKKYRLKPITIAEFKELVSIGECTANKNRHMFPPSKMFNIGKVALKEEEEEDNQKFLFLHRYNDRGFVMTWLGDENEKKTLIWSGDDIETFWPDYSELLIDRVIVTPRPKEILEPFAERLSEIGQYASFRYIDLVFLLGSCFKYEDRENLKNMVYVTQMVGQMPPKTEKELSDAVCAMFMTAVIDYCKPVMEYITSYRY